MYKQECFLDVRYYETDLMGIVHHSNYIRYFECGRNDALVSMGLPIRTIEERGIMMPVINVSCLYKSPSYQGDRLRIVSEIKELPKVKLTIETTIFNQENTLICTGNVTLGFIHSDTRKATRAPKFIVDLFAPYFNN